MAKLKLGVDVGGTFTDVVGINEDGKVYFAKTPSTPEDQSIGVLNGIRALLEELGVAPDCVTGVAHGTTVATNTLLERNGAVTALITTKGFRDVLDIGRQSRPELYDLHARKPASLIPRYLRREADERMDYIVNEFYGGLGNIAIMPYGELYTSLQNGLITATDQQIPSYIIENYYEVAPFYSYVGAQWTSYSLMMNLDKFNQYSEEDQKIFVDAAWACSEAEYESYKDMKADAEKFFDEKGITYYQPTDEELNQWKEYAASLSDKWRELIGEELYNQVSELFNY